MSSPVELILSAIEQATGKPRRKSGNSWRTLSPCCGGKSYKVSITEGSDGRALVTCFSCYDTAALLSAVGLSLGDLYPPRSWPESPDDRRLARMVMRQAGWAAALEVLPKEALIVLFAARELWALGSLNAEDGQRLRLAVERISKAADVLGNAAAWRSLK